MIDIPVDARYFPKGGVEAMVVEKKRFPAFVRAGFMKSPITCHGQYKLLFLYPFTGHFFQF